VANIVTHLRDFVASQSIRPLSMTAAIDLVLAHPHWRDHVDAAQIGGFGASFGAETMLLMAGAGLTTSLGFSSTSVEVDRRLKAAVGYVPYFGQPSFPAFGRDQRGLDGVTLPFLAIAGTADTTAPLIATQQGMTRLAGTRELVVLEGVRHGFDVASTNDIYTWTLTFFDAEVRGSAAARQKLSMMASVTGGGDDHVILRYNGGP
jgi:predicted dienelactone hydrolase